MLDHGVLQCEFLAVLASTVTYNAIDLGLKSHLRIITQGIMYQNIKLYILNTVYSVFCQSHLNKAEGERSP